MVALGFQTNITHFLCCRRDRGHGGLSPEDLPPHPPTHHHRLSPSTGPPPHHTGAAKSKCQSGRRRCIPPRGQSLVATQGSFALKLFPASDLCPGCKTTKPGFPHNGHLETCFLKMAAPHPWCCLIHGTYETCSCVGPCDVGAQEPRQAAPDPCVQVVPAAAGRTMSLPRLGV